MPCDCHAILFPRERVPSSDFSTLRGRVSLYQRGRLLPGIRCMVSATSFLPLWEAVDTVERPTISAATFFVGRLVACTSGSARKFCEARRRKEKRNGSPLIDAKRERRFFLLFRIPTAVSKPPIENSLRVVFHRFFPGFLFRRTRRLLRNPI